MSRFVNQLADLTAQRDHAGLDATLVSTINDLLQPQTVAICRVVGEADKQCWLVSAHMKAGQMVPIRESAWPDLDALPYLAQHPLRTQAVASRQIVQTGDDPNITVFPVLGTSGSSVVLELSTQAAIADADQHLVSSVLRMFVNFEELLDYGERDALTELLNRKTFDSAFLNATIAQQQVTDQPLDERRNGAGSSNYWLAILDIDHFKRVNDNYGHLIGDEVLLLLSGLMRSCFRFHDQLYRFGGEEFVVLMHCDGEPEAAGALERLRAATENFMFPQVGNITISIGFSEIKSGDTPSAAFERADKAVYHAKEHGRNQVCSYAALIASGALQEQAPNVGDMELF